jgi:hypothetical protein
MTGTFDDNPELPLKTQGSQLSFLPSSQDQWNSLFPSGKDDEA